MTFIDQFRKYLSTTCGLWGTREIKMFKPRSKTNKNPTSIVSENCLSRYRKFFCQRIIRRLQLFLSRQWQFPLLCCGLRVVEIVSFVFLQTTKSTLQRNTFDLPLYKLFNYTWEMRYCPLFIQLIQCFPAPCLPPPLVYAMFFLTSEFIDMLLLNFKRSFTSALFVLKLVFMMSLEFNI